MAHRLQWGVKNMSMFGCNCSCRCSSAIAAIVISVIAGVVAAFLQIAGVITVAPVFLQAVFIIAVAYLGGAAIVTALACKCRSSNCACSCLELVLIGALGTILFSLVLLAVGIVATSVLSAVLVGILLAFFALLLTGTACYVNNLADCGE